MHAATQDAISSGTPMAGGGAALNPPCIRQRVLSLPVFGFRAILALQA
ncbi:MAG: hypothetical protein IT464_04545 [Planctomycetes bacterium]|nr:hypothetical protein [Planctomycetota bacterium]